MASHNERFGMADSTRKTAIITGANKGLGCAIAIHLSTQGYDIVAVFARDGAAAAESASAIRANGARCELIQTDIRDPAQVSEMVAKTKIEFGGVDALVNCAGLRAAGPLIDLKCEDWDSVVAVNLKAPFLLSQAVARVMLTQARGAIVNIGAASGHRPRAGGGAYSAAKAALKALTEQMAVEWGPYGIRVNAVSPGAIEVPGSWAQNQAGYDQHAQRLPLRKKGTPADVAEAVGFLLSDRAAFITGQSLVIDGGGIHTWYLNAQ